MSSIDRPQRKRMRMQIDKVGREEYENWVPREEAIFAWTTFEKAVYYAERNYLEPAIVEFGIDGTAWCIDNHFIEVLFDEYSEETTDEEIKENIIKNANIYTGQREDKYEVWTQNSPITTISGVYDTIGNPLET